MYMCIKISVRYNFTIRLLKCISNEKKETERTFENLLRIFFRVYPCLQNSETFSRGLCNARIKRAESRTLVRWIHTVIDALNFRIYVSRPHFGHFGHFGHYHCSWKVGSQLSSDIENLGSALSRKVEKHNLDTSIVIRRNCNKASGEGGGLCMSDTSSTKIIRSFSKTAELLSSITKVLCKLMPIARETGTCYLKMRQTSR